MSMDTFHTTTSNGVLSSKVHAILSCIETLGCLGINCVISKHSTAQMLCSALMLEQISHSFKIYGVRARIVQAPKLINITYFTPIAMVICL